MAGRGSLHHSEQLTTTTTTIITTSTTTVNDDVLTTATSNRRPATSEAIAPTIRHGEVDRPESEEQSEAADLSCENGEPVTWGIELEFLFAFNQHELQALIDISNYRCKPTILKPFVDRIDHAALLQQNQNDAMQGRSYWPSWLLKVRADPQTQSEMELRQYVIENRGDIIPYIVRELGLEHLVLAQAKLETSGLKVSAVGRMKAQEDQMESDVWPGRDVWLQKQHTDSDSWHLTNVTSLLGGTKAEMREGMDGDVTEENQEDWNSEGMELVSRVFRCDELDTSFAEIRNHISAINPARVPTEPGLAPSSRTFGAFDSVFAGTYIHIGFPWKTEADIDTKMLRHLMFILLTHEELISELHPHRRQGLQLGWSPIAPVFPNTGGLGEDRDQYWLREQREEEICVAELREKYNSSRDAASNLLNFEHEAMQEETTWGDYRDKMFNDQIDLVDLLYLFQGSGAIDPDTILVPLAPGFLVNMKNIQDIILENPGAKPTIEFRQLSGSLDPDEIEHWVKFLLALVRLAGRKAHQSISLGFSEDEDEEEEGGDSSPRRSRMNPHLETMKYSASTLPCATIDALCGPDMLDLDEAETTYWTRRHAKFYNDDVRTMTGTRIRREQRILEKLRNNLPIDEADVRSLHAIGGRTIGELHHQYLQEQRQARTRTGRPGGWESSDSDGSSQAIESESESDSGSDSSGRHDRPPPPPPPQPSSRIKNTTSTGPVARGYFSGPVARGGLSGPPPTVPRRLSPSPPSPSPAGARVATTVVTTTALTDTTLSAHARTTLPRDHINVGAVGPMGAQLRWRSTRSSSPESSDAATEELPASSQYLAVDRAFRIEPESESEPEPEPDEYRQDMRAQSQPAQSAEPVQPVRPVQPAQSTQPATVRSRSNSPRPDYTTLRRAELMTHIRRREIRVTGGANRRTNAQLIGLLRRHDTVAAKKKADAGGGQESAGKKRRVIDYASQVVPGRYNLRKRK